MRFKDYAQCLGPVLQVELDFSTTEKCKQVLRAVLN